MNKRKIASVSIVVVYIVIMVSATLFVPVKASIMDGESSGGTVDMEAHAEYGYYPLWAVAAFNSSQTQHASTPLASPDTRVVLEINVTAWIVQYVCITLVFASLWWQGAAPPFTN